MDNIFANLFRFRQREVTPGVPVTTDPNHPTNQAQVASGDYQERIAYVRGPEQALVVASVYRAVNLRADTMSVMPVQYREKDFEKGNFTVKNKGLSKRLNYLLQVEPNPIMSAPDMWRLVEINRLFYGNAFIYIERDEFDLPLRLWLVRSGGYNVATGDYSSITYLTDYGYVSRVNVPRRDVMHFANTFRYQNGIWGIPTLTYAIEALTLNRTIRSQAMETAAKGGRVKLIIGEQPPASGYSPISQGLFDKREMDDYAKELQRKMYSGHDILAIRGLDKVQPISMTSAEMQMFEQMGATNDDVSRYFGVPRPLLMLDTNSHYNDYQNATMEFHTRTILPLKNANEKEIYRKIARDPYKEYGATEIHICEEPLMTMDPERRAKVDMLNIQTGAKTVNEIRADHDMPTVENGDEPMAAANLMTLKALIAKSDASTQLKPGNYTVTGNENDNDNQNQEQ
ncbi:MAG: phage portal protein [Prevotella sp.]|nr:phage portal protein [Prevotella sp.]